MKRFIPLLIIISFYQLIWASDGFEVKYEYQQNGAHKLDFTIGQYGVTTVNLNGTDYCLINFEGKVVTMRVQAVKLAVQHV